MFETVFTKRLILAILCCLFVAAPFVLTHYPPITDLAQHSAQIRLFLETLHSPEHSPYKIQWFTPYSLSYLVLGGSWALFGAENAGRVAILVIALLWIIAIHAIAAQRNRSGSSASIASLFALNHVFYWGFYSFAIGWPLFLLWFVLTAEHESSSPGFTEAMKWLATGLLLYVSHVLWFAAGVLWLILHGLVIRRAIGATLQRLLYLAPLFVAIWFWYPMFSSSSMSTPALWVTTPIERLSFSWLSDAALGGMRGLVESLVFGGVCVWIVLGVASHRKNLARTIDWELLAAAGMFFCLVMALPDKYMNTIRFGQRWMPPAVIMLLLAVPAPDVRPIFRQAAALVTVAAFCLVSTLAWVGFERTELSGLQEALDALPASSRVLGLSFVQKSRFVKGFPFIQTFAYSQALKGGTLNFSFAEFSPCLVVYKKPFVRPWTGGMEWFPRRVTESDLAYFEFALVNGTGRFHEAWAKNPRLSPVTRTGRWRLYRILPDPGEGKESSEHS